MSDITLEKIDLVRERTGVSYRRALDALEATDGDVVRAIVRLESESPTGGWQQRWQEESARFSDRVRELLREGNQTRVVIEHGDRRVLDLPATVAALGTIVAPYLAAAGAVTALATNSSIRLERRPSPPR